MYVLFLAQLSVSVCVLTRVAQIVTTCNLVDLLMNLGYTPKTRSPRPSLLGF